jgi:hypothetical protein
MKKDRQKGCHEVEFDLFCTNNCSGPGKGHKWVFLDCNMYIPYEYKSFFSKEKNNK